MPFHLFDIRQLPLGLSAAAVLWITALPALSQTVISYDYDVLGQLTERTIATGPDAFYDYDDVGNRKTFDVSGVFGGVAPGAPEGEAEPAQAAPGCSPVSGCAAD